MWEKSGMWLTDEEEERQEHQLPSAKKSDGIPTREGAGARLVLVLPQRRRPVPYRSSEGERCSIIVDKRSPTLAKYLFPFLLVSKCSSNSTVGSWVAMQIGRRTELQSDDSPVMQAWESTCTLFGLIHYTTARPYCQAKWSTLDTSLTSQRQPGRCVE